MGNFASVCLLNPIMKFFIELTTQATVEWHVSDILHHIARNNGNK
jgi:hypothetical protein